MTVYKGLKDLLYLLFAFFWPKGGAKVRRLSETCKLFDENFSKFPKIFFKMLINRLLIFRDASKVVQNGKVG